MDIGLDSLLKDVSKETIRDDHAHHVLKIVVVHGNTAQEDHSPDHVSIIIEGKEVLDDCKSVAKACLLLMSFIYAMNLSYPPKLKYTLYKCVIHKCFRSSFLSLTS